MNIRCPYSGDRISVTTEWRGYPYSGEYVPSGFECDNYNCGAEWGIDGNVTVEGNND